MATTKTRDDPYEIQKERSRERQATLASLGRDIGSMPPPADLARRNAACDSFRVFCETYFAERFTLAWSDDHLKVIDIIERVVNGGGQFALAMPRGSGKTSLCEAAVIWATATGKRRFAVLVGAAKKASDEMMDSVKSAIETNDLLAADFPEVCLPIRALEGLANRCKGQLSNGERTHVGLGKDSIVFATLPNSVASGAVIRLTSITGRARGMKFARPDGQTVRPDLLLIDDPQTDVSAKSITQCEQRERIIAGAFLGLAGPGETIAAFATCTVMRRGDLADALLDRDRNPTWQGERLKLVYEFPANGRLWEEYAVRRADEIKNGGDGSLSTQFYADNQAAMDAGCRIAWPARFKPGERSAIQNAMNLKIDDEQTFFAEYQNEPLVDDDESASLNYDDLIARGTGLAKGRVPLDCQRLTAFVDIQQKALFWLVAGWTEDFGGHVVDYGTWPDQQRGYYSLSDIKTTIQSKFRGAGLEGCIFQSLEACATGLLGREFLREDSAVLRIERMLIDANWGASTETVYKWCRQSKFSGLITPSHGKFIGPESAPFEHCPRRDGEVRGLHWWLPTIAKKRAIRHVMIDTNWWKSFVAARLMTTVGDRGALTLCGKAGATQRLLCEHFTAEMSVRTKNLQKTGGHEVDVWKLKPNRDNHYWDCLVGTAVAASMLGVKLLASQERKPPPARPRKNVSYLF